jgi:hypothetical protein
MGNNCLSAVCCCYRQDKTNDISDQIIKTPTELTDQNLKHLIKITQLPKDRILYWHEQFLV